MGWIPAAAWVGVDAGVMETSASAGDCVGAASPMMRPLRMVMVWSLVGDIWGEGEE